MNKHDYEQDLFDRIISSMLSEGLQDCADSVLLAGSFGRDEATYEYNGDDVTLKSDVEIGVVYTQKKRALNMISAVQSRFSEELNCMPLSVRRMSRFDNFNNAIFPQKKKTMFMYDLATGSKTIWGKDYTGSVNLTIDDIDLFEAKRVVANRIGELVYTQGTNDGDVTRWKAKLVSAVGTAYLLFAGKYNCSYHAQMNAVDELKDVIDNELCNGFYAKYKQSFAYLRQGADGFDIADTELRCFVDSVSKLCDKHGVNTPMINTFSRKLKYILKYVKSTKKLNIFGLENRIINSLINEFVTNSDTLPHTAKLWHNVLY